MTRFAPTPQQQAIFAAISDPHGGSMVISAVAGSGKTTTIVEAANRLPVTAKAIFLAFNRNIRDELSHRLPPNVPCKTFHGACFAALRAAFPAAADRRDWLNTKKPYKLLDALIDAHEITKRESHEYGVAAVKLLSLARQYGIGAIRPDEYTEWAQLIRHHDVDCGDFGRNDDLSALLAEFISVELTEPDDEYGLDGDDTDSLIVAEFDSSGKASAEPLVIALARRLLALSCQSVEQMIDFDDQIYMPLRLNLRLPTYSYVFVDEAQDLNDTQRAILRRLVAPNGRIIAVGDPHQAIYGFRGANADAFWQIQRDFNATVYPLSVSFRCPRRVVELAREIVDHIEPAANAPEGAVRRLGIYEQSDWFRGSSSLIVCRNVAPMIRMAFWLIRQGVGCRVRGRDIGSGLISLIDKLKAHSITDLHDRLDAHLARETERARARDDEMAVAGLLDKVETIRCIAANLPLGKSTIDDLQRQIVAMFDDQTNGGIITLSTVHGAKGLEYDHVWVLDDHLMPSRWAKRQWQQDQEQNLRYVAYTRAKRVLSFVQSPAEKAG